MAIVNINTSDLLTSTDVYTFILRNLKFKKDYNQIILYFF